MRQITVAIHTYNRAVALKKLLEKEGIKVELQNVNLEEPTVSSGVRVRIHEKDLALALRIIENMEIFAANPHADNSRENTVLVPVDFNDMTMNAVRVAFEIAHHHSLDIKFLHSYLDGRPTVNVQLSAARNYEMADMKFRRQLEETANKRMAHFIEHVREMLKVGLLPMVKFSSTVIEGVPEDAIVDYAKEHSPYMIVMGTRCAAQKQTDMIGSVSSEVLDKCACTVLTVPETSTLRLDKKLNRIVFLTNMEQEDLLALDTMNRIMTAITGHINIVPIPGRKRIYDKGIRNSTAESLLNYCRKNFERFDFSFSEIEMDLGTEELAKLASEKDIDLIVLPNKRKNIFARFFNPGIAHNILLNADIPMLVIRV